MDTGILRLEDIRKNDVPIAGGKGANLGELAGKGFPVPPGFVVSARSCENFIKAIGLEKLLQSLNEASPDNIHRYSSEIRSRIEESDTVSYTHLTLPTN